MAPSAAHVSTVAVAVLAVAAVVAVVATRATALPEPALPASAPAAPLRDTLSVDPVAPNAARLTVVLVHGFRGSPSDMASVHRAFLAAAPGATVSNEQYDHDQGLAHSTAQVVAAAARAAAKNRTRSRVVFVAHSMGGVAVLRALPALPKTVTEGGVSVVTVATPHLGVDGAWTRAFARLSGSPTARDLVAMASEPKPYLAFRPPWLRDVLAMWTTRDQLIDVESAAAVDAQHQPVAGTEAWQRTALGDNRWTLNAHLDVVTDANVAASIARWCLDRKDTLV
jgi:alpha-beta hydrolase superfamily lysophospholipase